MDTLCYNESMTKICTIETCERESKAYGLCNAHSMMKWRGQEIKVVPARSKRHAVVSEDGALLPLGYEAKNGYAKIDPVDAENLSNHKWVLSKRGYPVTSVGGTIVTLHRFLLGKASAGFVVDHKDRDKLNNKRENLRFITQSQNNQNISKQKNNTSGYRGVWKTPNGKWVANIKVNYIKLHLGRYDSKEEAAKAYDKSAIEHFGEFAVLNFPEGQYGTAS